MRIKKKLIIIMVCVAIAVHFVPCASFAIETKRSQENQPWSENVDQDTIITYPVDGGNLYLGQWNGEISEEMHLFGADSTVTQANIPEYISGFCVTSISARAFVGCSNLIKVSIPKTVTTIAETAFFECSALTEFIVADGNPRYYSLDGVLFHNFPFVGVVLMRYPAGSTRKAFTIPEDTVLISAYAFQDANNLESVRVPQSVTNIGYNAFQNCNSLTEIFYAGSSSKWEQVRIDCSNNVICVAQIHCDWYANLIEAIAQEIQSDKDVLELFLFAGKHRVASYLIVFLITVLVVFVLVLFFNRRNIRERNRYVRYQYHCSQVWGYSSATLLYHRDPTKKNRYTRLSTRVFQLAAIALSVVAIMSEIILATNLDREIPIGWIILLPLLILVGFLLIGFLTAWVVGLIRNKLNIARSTAVTSPMRVRKVGKGRDKE